MENQPLWCCFEGFVLRLRLLIASMPGSPAGGRDGACLPLDHVVCCSSASGAVVRVLWSSVGPRFVWLSGNWNPFVLPRLVRGGCWVVFFLPLLVAPSLEAPQHVPARFCGWPLSLAFGLVGLPLRRRVHARVLMVACLPLLRVWRTAPSLIPLMLCASTGIYFRSILSSSRLSFVWVFGGLVQAFSCLALSVPVGVHSGFAPADFSSLWFCLVERI